MNTPVHSQHKTSPDIALIRKDFPILSRLVHGKPLVYFDNAASSQKPNQVLAAMDHYYQTTHANVHRGVHTLSQDATELFEEARKTVARFIKAPHEHEIIFTRGTTESINLVAYSFGLSQLNAGDEVIISGMEHHSNIVPWQIVCQMRQANLRVIPVLPSGELSPDAFESLITDKTKIVAIGHVSNSLGTINPIEIIIDIAHRHDIPVLIDGAQAAPHIQLDMVSLDADFYAFSGHKMYGPTGMGILYGKTSWLDKLPPWQGGGEMIAEVKWTGTTYNKLPFKFEAGTPDIAGAIGLAAACDYLESFDRSVLAQYEADLLAYCTQTMSQLPGIIPVGTASHKTGVYSFNIQHLHPYDVGTILDQQGIAVRTGHHCTQPLMDQFCIPGTVRASFSFYNTYDEIDRLTEATSKAIRLLS